MVRSKDFQYCLMMRDQANWWIQNGTKAMEDYRQKRAKHATTERKRDRDRDQNLQKRKRYAMVRDHPGENPGKAKVGLLGDTAALMMSTDPNLQAQDVVLPKDIAWISSRFRFTSVKVFDSKYDLEDCEHDQWSLRCSLGSSDICLLIYGTSSQSLVVFDTLHPLPEEDERLVCDSLLFIIGTANLNSVDLKIALKLAPDFPIWLIPKDEVNRFKSQWREEHQPWRQRMRRASPKIQSAPPDTGDNLADDTLFGDDSTDDRDSISIKSLGSARGRFSQHIGANNSALVVLSALNGVPRAHITAPSEADNSGPMNSPGRPSIKASLVGEPREEASLSEPVINRRIDSVDETEYTSNTTVLSLTFIQGDTSASIRPSLIDLSTSYAEEGPDKVSSKQKQVAFEGFSSEGLQRKKRLYIHKDSIDIQRRADEERATKVLRRDLTIILLKRLLLSEDTVCIWAQVEKEPEQK